MVQARLERCCCSSCGYGCGSRLCRYCGRSIQAPRTTQGSMGELPCTTTPHAHRGLGGIHQWLWQCGTQRLGVGTRSNNHDNSNNRIEGYWQALDDNPSRRCSYNGVLLAHILRLSLSARHTAWRTSWHSLRRGRFMDISSTARNTREREKLENMRYR